MKLDQFRKMSEPWTWQTICDIQMLFDTGGNIETCDPFTFTLEAIDYDSQTIFGDCISAHITDASRRTYLENGLCNGIGNEDHCPEYFRTRYVEIYEHLQTEAKQVHKKPPIVHAAPVTVKTANAKKRIDSAIYGVMVALH